MRAGRWPKFLRAWVASVSLFAAGLSHALPAPPDNTIYANVGTALYTVNPSTGAATSVGTLTFSTSGFGRDPITGRVYYAEAALPGRIAYWDPTTGLNTILPTALGFATNRMGFRADGQMFSMNPGTNNIYVIDKVSGNPSIVATVQGVVLNGGGDLAFTPSGDMYIVTSSTIYKVFGNPIAVPAVGAIPVLPTTAYAATTAGSPTGLTFIDNGVALATPTTGIADLGLTGTGSNPRGANSYSDLGSMPKFADLVISATPSTTNFPRTGGASYAVNVLNNGPQSASGNFTVTFSLPAGVSLVGGGPFGSGWSCVVGPPVVCTHTTSSLVVGASLPTLNVPVTTSVAGGINSVSTTFVVTDTTFDQNTANNSTTVATGVGAAAIAKVFSPNVMAPGGTSTLIFTLSNPTATAFTGVSFSDTFPTTPGAMKVATLPNASTSGCGTPTFAPAAAAASISFAAGSIAAGGTCTVRVDVTAPTSGTYSNTSSGVVTTQTGAAAGAVSNTAALLLMSPATISKAFATSPVIPGGPSALTITLTNPAANGTNDIIGATFTDVFPTTPGAMTLADAVFSTTCGGTLSDAGGAALAAGSTSVKLVGATVPANGTCTVKLNVKGATVGTYNNTTGAVSSANAGTGLVSNTAPLVVQANVAPSIAKNFAPAQIAVGATSVLTFTITNPNPTTALTGVAFSDVFPTSPGNMTVATTPGVSTSGCGSPTFAPAANAASVTFSAGTIAAGGTCTVNVNVTVNAVGAYTNISNAVTASGPSALTGNTATAVIATLAPPVIAKAFSPSTIGTNGVSTVTISISNPNGSQTLTGVAMTDTFPAGLKVAAVPNASVTGCGAPTYAPVAAATSVVFSNGSIVGSGLCVISFNVTSAATGSYTNTTGIVTTANGGSGVADSDILTVVATAPASISKAFLTNPMAAGAPGVLRFTIVNPNPVASLAGVAFSDTLPTAPGAMLVSPTPGASTSGCGTPTFAPVAGAASVAFSAGSIAAGATCTVNVNVVAAVAGSYANTTGTVTSTAPITTGNTASANVDVLAAPGISKTFVTNPVAVGVPTTLRFDVSNPNALALTNLSFTDVLPTSPGAMVVAPLPNVTTGAGCGATSFTPAAGASSISFSTSSIAAGATCRVTVDVVAPVVGSYANTTTAITSSNGGTGPVANATLSAISLNLPTLLKTFASAGPISPGVVNALTISIGNNNASAITLSSALIDNLPAGVVVASPAGSVGTCLGVTAVPGDTKITLANGSSIPAGGCSIVVNVVGNTGGNFTNTLAVGALATSAGSNAAATSASFSVPAAPVALKQFTPSSVAVGATSQLKITLTNPNASTAISGAAFTDTYPAGLVNTAAATGALSGAGCVGTVTATNGGNALALSGGTVPAGGSCDITVNVSSATAASYLNSSGAITTTNVGTGNASSATLAVTVGSPLTVLKSFSIAAVAPGATSQLKIRLTNPNGVAITGAAFTDNYPSGLVNTAAPAAAISGVGCTGSVTATVNGTSLALAAGNIPASSACDIVTNVTSSTPGSYLNNSGTVATINGGTAAASSATLVVLSPPNVLKNFTPSAVSVGGTSQLKIMISNPNSGTALTGVTFTDTYPAGLVNTATPAGAISGAGCVGTVAASSGGNTLTLSAGTVPAGGTCDITVNVSSATAATYNNSSGPVTTSAGIGAASIGTLSVVSGPAPLTVSKAFSPASIGTNDSTVLTITLLNPNGVAVTGAAFTDNYPFSLSNTATPAPAVAGTAGCAGSLTAAANGSSLVLSGGNVPANGSCTFSANVSSNAVGTVVNSTGAVTTTNAGSTSAASGTLTVLSHMTVAKSFTPTSVTAGIATVLKITLTNPNAVAINGVSLTDSYPGGLLNTGTPSAAITGAGCTGTVVAAANDTSLGLTGATLPAGGSCDISANVTSAAAGSYVNNTGAVASSNAGAGASAGATLTVTSAVLLTATMSKTFTPASIAAGDNSVLSVTLNNPNATAVTGAAFIDNYPSGLSNTGSASFNPASISAGCTGTLTGVATGTSLQLTGGTLPANATCVININVTSNSAAATTHTNPVFSLSSSNAPTANAVAAVLQVLAKPSISQAYSVSTIPSGGSSMLTFTLANSNAGALSNAQFTDALSNVSVASTTIGGTCLGVGNSPALTVGATALNLTVPNLPAGGCTVTLSITGTVPGSWVNTASGVTTNQTSIGAASNATPLTVMSLPIVGKSFSVNPVAKDATTQVIITVTNNNAVDMTGVAFTDNYPTTLPDAPDNKLVNVDSITSASPVSCSGTLLAAAGQRSLSLTGGTVPANTTCTYTANVKTSSSAVPANYINNSGPVTTANAGAGASASATLQVFNGPTVAKSFAPTSIPVGASSQLTITLGTTAGGAGTTAAALTDTYPAGLVNIAGTPLLSNSCGGTVVAAPGGNSVSISGGSIPPNSTCAIVVRVTSASLGSYVNTIAAGALTSSSGSNAAGDTATLVVPARPTISKAFSPASITAGGTTTLTFALGNINSTALNNATFTDALSGMSVAATTMGGTCVGASNTPALTLGATALNVQVPSLPAGGCTVTVQITSNSVGVWPNTSSGVSTTEIPSAGTPSNTANLTVTPAFTGVSVAGVVYADANHNMQRDSGEAGTGLTLYAKLVPTGSATGPALQAVVVDPATGAYVFTAVAPANYFIVIDDNNTLADVTSTLSSSWTGTEMADGTRRNVAVAAVDLPNQNFGVFNGNVVTGRVFRDNGSGAGTANNGIQDGSEVGLANAVVRLTNGAATTYDSTTTAADGSWRLWMASALAGSPLRVVQDSLIGYRAVAGAPAISYDRASNSVGVSYTLGTAVSGLNFGDVAMESLVAPQQGTVVAGSSLLYAHRFTPGTVGSLTFVTIGTAAWAHTLYLDNNCNGVLDAGEAPLGGAITTSAGTPVCVVVVVQAPAGAAMAAQHLLTLQAQLAYSNATPALVTLLSNEDLSTVTVAASAGAALRLVKSQDTNSLLPGGRIQYTLTYTHQGSSPLTSLRISDFTPAYTRFVSASCLLPLAAGLTACTLTSSPAVGAAGGIEWLLSGSLLPSASGQVIFSVDLVSTP
jgi:mucin-19